MGEITKYITTSTYIVFENKVLLYVHKKYDILLPVGGHIDRDDLPENSAKREALEESGLDIEFFNSRKYDDFSNDGKNNN
jgi:8-oxo-dGTP pyrophosphatase MutT (NUDIX family)